MYRKRVKSGEYFTSNVHYNLFNRYLIYPTLSIILTTQHKSCQICKQNMILESVLIICLSLAYFYVSCHGNLRQWQVIITSMFAGHRLIQPNINDYFVSSRTENYTRDYRPTRGVYIVNPVHSIQFIQIV